MDISLNKQQEKFVRESVSSGRYGSVDQVVQEAIALLQATGEQSEHEYWADVRTKVAIGLEQLQRGEGIPGEVVFQELRQKSKELRETRSTKKPTT